MKQMTLNILKEDIEKTNYIDGSDCAITRALKRAGFQDYRDCGMYIRDQKRKIIIDGSNEDYIKLSEKVFRMYNGGILPKDFTVTINY